MGLQMEAESKRLLIGSIAVEMGLLSQEQLDACLKERESGQDSEPLGRILVRRGLIKSEALSKLLAEQAKRVRELSDELGQRQRHLDAELKVAREIQRALIPSQLPDIRGVDLAAYFNAAEAIGGDFYDVGKIADTRWYLSIGDVSGKGIPAALIMSMALGLLRVAALSQGSPSDILAQVNSLLKGRMSRGSFLTMLYMVFDSASKTARLACAGHPPPIALRKDGKAEPVKGAGAAIGLLTPQKFYKSIEEIPVDLTSISKLVFYTDGLIEAMGPKNEKYGTARLREMLESTTRLSSFDTLQEILTDLGRHREGKLLNDDIAVLCVKF
jgi:sigma-B regulation protein RsbU (phosphoserine phosphatase)